jgi:aspartyl-tRNA synthetase
LSAPSGTERIDVRMVIGALIVKHKLKLNDRQTVMTISENIYLQYFCGLRSFQIKEPFHPTVFVDIRKRMGSDRFDLWNELSIEKADSIKPKRKQNIDKDKDDRATPTTNKGTLKIDASVANQKIVFPTDANLLNTARKESERIIDLLYKQTGSKVKPRGYRRVAGKE